MLSLSHGIATESIFGSAVIGSTNPQYLLDVNGGMRAVGGITSSIADSQTVYGSAAGPAMVFKNTDGTTNNYATVQVWDATTTVGSYGFQYVDRTNHYGDFLVGTKAADGYKERLRVTSAGNVGIGTTSPGTYLDINQATTDRGALRVKGGDTSAGTWNLGIDNSAGSHLLYVYNNGNVGIASTSPAQPLDVNGNIKTSGTLYNGWEKIIGIGTSTLNANVSNATASCSTGKQVIGGGCGTSCTPFYILNSYPSNATTWQCTGLNQCGGTNTLTAYVLCARIDN